MKTFWSLANFLLLVLSLLAVIIWSLLDANKLVSSARQVNTFTRLSESITDLLPDQQGIFTKTDVRDILAQSIEPDRFYTDLTQITQGYIDLYKGSKKAQTVNIDLTKYRDNISTASVSLLTKKYDALPVCTTKQYPSWAFGDTLPECKLPEDVLSHEDLLRMVKASSSDAVSFIPDKFDINSPSPATLTITSLVFFGIYALWVMTAASILMFIVVFRQQSLGLLAITVFTATLLILGVNQIFWDYLIKNLNEGLATATELKAISPLIADVTTTFLASVQKQTSILIIVLFALSLFLAGLGIVGRLGNRDKLTLPVDQR